MAQEIRPIPSARLAKSAPISVGAGPVKISGSGAPIIWGAKIKAAPIIKREPFSVKAIIHNPPAVRRVVANHQI